MKILLSLLAIATCCTAAAVAYPTQAQNGLLLLPLQRANDSASTTSTTSRPALNGTEGLEDVNAKLQERLKQEQGSEQGEYHVYLQDGRLQKVRYTTAPVTSAQQTQQQQTASNQQPQTPEILSPGFAEKRGVYFVQVPQERIQALQANAQQIPQPNQNFQASAPAQDSTAQLQTAPADYRQSPADVPVVRYLPVPLTEQAAQYRRQEEAPAGGYQAVVQYSEVQPIQGPVYSYTPGSLTRILRYAPVY